jgi:uncharacterized membrane protein
MIRRIVMTLTLICALAASGCGAEPQREGDEEEDELDVSESSAALSLPDFFAGRIFTVRGDVAAGAGNVVGSTPDRRARCDGSVCYARFGATVTLTATAAPGSVFAGWSGCSHSTNPVLKFNFVVSSQRCSAHFASAPSVTVRWTVNGPGGSVRGAPEASCDDERCVVASGSPVTLTAVPHVGYRFLRWYGCASGYEETLNLTPTSDVTCSVDFMTVEGGGSPRFDGLGDVPGGDSASYATDVDAKGETVVGYSRNADGDVAVRWTLENGLQPLGGAASRARGISPNGKIIVGSIAKPDYQLGRAGVIFDLMTGPRVLTMATMQPEQPPLFLVTDGVVPLDNGQVYATCIQYGAYGDPEACRWTAPATVDLLTGSLLYAADASNTFAGTRLPGHHGGPYGSVAFIDSTELGYPAGSTCLVPHQCRSEARAFSADHSVVVGTSSVPALGMTNGTLYDTAFVYTAAEGTLRLPDLAGGDEASGAYSVSADGRVIGGFGSDADGRRAVLWIDRVPRALDELMHHFGGSPPSGWVLLDVQAMSSDARTLVGNALNASGQPEAFRVTLQRAPYQPISNWN